MCISSFEIDLVLTILDGQIDLDCVVYRWVKVHCGGAQCLDEHIVLITRYVKTLCKRVVYDHRLAEVNVKASCSEDTLCRNCSDHLRKTCRSS